jgi:hypothetical protein
MLYALWPTTFLCHPDNREEECHHMTATDYELTRIQVFYSFKVDPMIRQTLSGWLLGRCYGVIMILLFGVFSYS